MADDSPFSIDSDWKKQAQEEKRRLAEEAKQRQQAAPPPSGQAPASATAAAPGGAARAGRRRPRGEMPEASFTTLVQTLASQALLYMGGMGVPGAENMVDLDTAKHQIDLMAVLEDKTQGNLSDEERQALDVALYETRMRYVGVASRYIL